MTQHSSSTSVATTTSAASTAAIPPISTPVLDSPVSRGLDQLSDLELAQALAERLIINPAKWHQLKSNRAAHAREQAAMALVFLLKDQPAEALPRLQQAVGWLDRSISQPPCPSHGH